MTAYNVIGAATMVGGQPEDVSQVLANFNAIANVINGNLDNANISPAAGITLSRLGQSGAATNNVPIWNGTAWVPGTSGVGAGVAGDRYVTKGGVGAWARPQAISVSPGDPGGTLSPTQVMMGMGGVVQLTPAVSGTVIVDWWVRNITGGGFGNPASGNLRYGSGGAPGNGSALTGTVAGNTIVGGDAPNPRRLVAKIAGLTVGTTYWFDLALSTPNNNATAVVQENTVTVLEM
jgi:hypothetical protein